VSLGLTRTSSLRFPGEALTYTPRAPHAMLLPQPLHLATQTFTLTYVTHMSESLSIVASLGNQGVG